MSFPAHEIVKSSEPIKIRPTLTLRARSRSPGTFYSTAGIRDDFILNHNRNDDEDEDEDEDEDDDEDVCQFSARVCVFSKEVRYQVSDPSTLIEFQCQYYVPEM